MKFLLDLLQNRHFAIIHPPHRRRGGCITSHCHKSMSFTRRLLYFSGIIFTVIPAILFCNETLFARGKGSSMGNIRSVASDGPFDAARNPALLPLLAENSAGAYFSYKYFSGIETDSSQNISINNPGIASIETTNYSASDPDITGMSGHVACTFAFDNTSIGFAATESGKDQYSTIKNKSYTELSGTLGGTTPVTLNIKSESETEEINPAFAASLGFRLSNENLIGFQIIITTLNKVEKSKSDLITAGYNESKQEIIKKDRGISAEIGLGYLKKTDNTQIGLLIESGNFSWIKKNADYNYYKNDYVTSSEYTGKSSRSIDGEHTTGINLTAGGFSRINSFIALAFEASLRMADVFTDKDMQLNTDIDPPVFEKKSNTITIKNTYSIGGGVEINPVNDLAFMLGIGRINSGSESSDNSYMDYDNGAWGFNSYQYSFLTYGIYYKFLHNVNIIISGALVRIKATGRYESRYENEETGEYKKMYIQEKRKGEFIDIGMGLNFIF